MSVVVGLPLAAEPVASPLLPAPALTPRLEADPFDAGLWARAEAWSTGTPFQRLDWVRAHAEAFAADEGFEPRLVSLRDRTGEVAGLVPLAVGRRAGLRVAAIAGGRHASFHMPVLAEDALLSPGDLTRIGRLVGADAVLLSGLPRAWAGRPNPLAAGAPPSPSNAYELALLADGEATLRAALSADKRKKLRQKERYLAEIGPVRHLIAGSAAEIDRLLAAFLAQKADRFAELGITDPFAGEAAQAFLRRACLAGLERGRPAMELHGLLAGERVVAVFGAAVDGGRSAGMVISFDADPGIARCSPGDLLLARVIADSCAKGRSRFDLGVGEARYKASFCPTAIELVDVAAAVTWRGRAYLAATARGRAAKRWIKSNPRAWKAVSMARRLRAALPSRP